MAAKNRVLRLMHIFHPSLPRGCSNFRIKRCNTPFYVWLGFRRYEYEEKQKQREVAAQAKALGLDVSPDRNPFAEDMDETYGQVWMHVDLLLSSLEKIRRFAVFNKTNNVEFGHMGSCPTTMYMEIKCYGIPCRDLLPH